MGLDFASVCRWLDLEAKDFSIYRSISWAFRRKVVGLVFARNSGTPWRLRWSRYKHPLRTDVSFLKACGYLPVRMYLIYPLLDKFGWRPYPITTFVSLERFTRVWFNTTVPPSPFPSLSPPCFLRPYPHWGLLFALDWLTGIMTGESLQMGVCKPNAPIDVGSLGNEWDRAREGGSLPYPLPQRHTWPEKGFIVQQYSSFKNNYNAESLL